MRFRPNHLFFVLLAVLAIAGCGGDGGASSSATPATTTTLPALARSPRAAGEIVVSADASPLTRGPYAFDGRYLVRFEQYAPEDPRLDFASQTPFSAALAQSAGDAAGAVKLFEAADRTGRRELTIRGRYVVDVSFGDFPFVIRFTPRQR
jgi:hypothetical protein